MYGFYPRGRSYLECAGVPNIGPSNKFSVLDCDIYQVGWNDSDNFNLGMMLSSGNKRGLVRYLKVPAFNPSGLHLTTFGPSEDGYSYIMIRCGFPWDGRASTALDGATTAIYQWDVGNTYPAPSSFARSSGPFGGTLTYTDPDSEYTVYSAGLVWMYRFLMMPII